MSRTLLVALALLAVDPAAAEPLSAEQALDTYKSLTTTIRPCKPAEQPDEIVVCGRAEDHRLPLRDQRDREADGGPVIGEVAAGKADPIRPGSCGVLLGGRVCNQGLTIVKTRF